jgi:hypothetical protein
LLPFLVWFTARFKEWSVAWWLRFFAGFCLIANGGYLLGGSVVPVGDVEMLIRFGVPRVLLAGIGIIAIIPGLALWHGLGKHFGFGPTPAPIKPLGAFGVALLLAVTIFIECILSRLCR